MRRLVAMVACLLLATSCDSRDPVEPALIEEQPYNTEDLKGWWKALDPSSSRLRLHVGDLAQDRRRALLGKHVRLADGGLLAQFTFTPHEFESLTCYVDLQADEGSWMPRAAGVFYGWCVGMGWVAELTGSITVDTSDPAELLFRIDLDGDDGEGGGLPSGHVFRGVYRILTAVESSELREDFRRWPEGPALARK